MKRWPWCLVLCVFALCALAEGPAADLGPKFDVKELAEGVWLFQEISPWECNHVVLATEKGLVLVDPGGAPAIARALRRAVKARLGRGDFAYVIDHHHHWGHTWGNASFPEAVVIGHTDCVPLMEAEAEAVDAKIALFKRLAGEADAKLRRSDASSAVLQSLRIEMEHYRRVAESLAEEGFSVRPPDLTFSDRMTLRLGDLTLELTFIGPGHSETDTVIFIPEHRILLMGCFFLERNHVPAFAVQPELDVDRWLAVFDPLLQWNRPVRMAVPGQHGLWTAGKLQQWRDYIAETWEAVKAQEKDGKPLAEAQENIPVPQVVLDLREEGVSRETLDAFHRRNVQAFWRQLKDPADRTIIRMMREQGTEAGVKLYAEMLDNHRDELMFDEQVLNAVGYQILGRQETAEAVAFFELNVKAFPDSWNVYDSLAEAYMVSGNREKAVEYYRKSLEMNPDNVNGRNMLERLEAPLPEKE